MNADALAFHFPTDAPLPPPPPANADDMQHWQAERVAEFYQSAHYEDWYRRTLEEMRHAERFVM